MSCLPMADNVKVSKDKNRTHKDANFTEEPCNSEDLNSNLPLVTAEQAIHTEIKQVAGVEHCCQQMATKYWWNFAMCF